MDRLPLDRRVYLLDSGWCLSAADGGNGRNSSAVSCVLLKPIDPMMTSLVKSCTGILPVVASD